MIVTSPVCHSQKISEVCTDLTVLVIYTTPMFLAQIITFSTAEVHTGRNDTDMHSEHTTFQSDFTIRYNTTGHPHVLAACVASDTNQRESNSTHLSLQDTSFCMQP